MANQSLIRGAGMVASSRGQVFGGGVALQSIAEADQAAQQIQQRRKAAKDQINSKTASYINNLNSNVDLTKLSDQQQKGITDFLSAKKNEYAQAAGEIARIEDPRDPRYIELKDTMNGIQSSFSNLSDNLKAYKEDRANYLQDFDSGRLSEGNDLNSLSLATKLYVDQADFGISPQGELMAYDDDAQGFKSYSEFQKPFLKDFKAADGILKVNNSLYNAGAALTGARRNMIKNQLNQMISKGGRQSLVSLAKDDFMIPGGLGIQDEKLFEPGNEAQLKEVVMESYLEALSDTARQGANDKRPASNSGTAGLSGALKDEVTYGMPEAQKAEQFAAIASEKVPGKDLENKAYRIAQTLNSVNPAKAGSYVSRGQAYEGYIRFKNEEAKESGEDPADIETLRNQFISKYPRSQQLFLENGNEPKPIERNIDNPNDLFELYIRNSNLSRKAQNVFITQMGQTQQNNTKDSKPSGSLDNI